ncbi:hypothetical protein R1flu_026455 [Riccia fluitans]|uniref:Uncharacterized protein n=1 Tax=Riccia fluitans TaxID=41844 RepID=A0ABD1XG01_9MARC
MESFSKGESTGKDKAIGNRDETIAGDKKEEPVVIKEVGESSVVKDTPRNKGETYPKVSQVKVEHILDRGASSEVVTSQEMENAMKEAWEELHHPKKEMTELTPTMYQAHNTSCLADIS